MSTKLLTIIIPHIMISFVSMKMSNIYFFFKVEECLVMRRRRWLYKSFNNYN